MRTSTQCSLFALSTLLLSSTALATPPGGKAGLFAQRRGTPRKVRNKADWSPARAPLLGGWLGKRVQRTDTTLPSKQSRNKLQQTRVTRHVVPGWGNNQAGVRSHVEVYTDKRTGNPVVRTIQRVKSHTRQTYQYWDPASGKTRYASARSQIPKAAQKVRHLSAYWLNTVKVSERRTMALTPRARRAAILIASAIKSGRDLPRSALSYFAQPLSQSLRANHKPPSVSSRSSSRDDRGPKIVNVGGFTVGGISTGGVQMGHINAGGVNVGGIEL